MTMRNFIKLPPRTVWKLFSLAVIALLFAAAGCALLNNDEDGQNEPPRLAEYVVTVSPPERSLTITPLSTVVPVSVEIHGRCLGDFIPPNCATHRPFWAASPSPRFRGQVTFNNVQSPDTIAIVSFDAAAYLGSIKPSSLTDFSDSIPIGFYPRSELRDVGLRRGRFDLHVNFELPVADNQEVPSSEARLTVAPNRLAMTLTHDQTSPAIMEATISYKGPATTLIIDGPRDTYAGPRGSAAKFLVLHPPSSFPLAANGTVTLIVQFQTPLLDFTSYKAELTAVLATNLHAATVFLKGHREF